MANDIASLCRPSKDGSMVSICQLGEFYAVSYFGTRTLFSRHPRPSRTQSGC
jgi:hypothetical protein